MTKGEQKLTLLWAAFLVSNVTLGAVGWIVATTNPASAPLEPIVLYVLVAVGTSTPLVGALIAQRWLETSLQVGKGEPPSGEELVRRATPPIVLGLALRESGAVFALAVLIMGGDPVLWAIPAGVAFASTLVAKPSLARVERATRRGP